MGTALQEAPAAPTADELLEEARRLNFGYDPRAAKAELVPVKLTVSQAGYLWEKLYLAMSLGTRYRPETAKRERVTVAPALFSVLDDRLEKLPPTTPFVIGLGRVRFLNRRLTLLFMRHEARYLLQILKNKKRDEWRRQKLERERFAPLEVAEMAEESGDRASFFSPSHAEHPDAMLRKAVLKKALGELPKALKMTPEDVRLLLAALAAAQGNVSEAARQLGWPQRRTARRVERIARHLKRRGLAA